MCARVCVCVCVFVFGQVLELEDRKGEWGFKALKQMMKILFRKVYFDYSIPVSLCYLVVDNMYVLALKLQGDFEEMQKKYKQLLTYIKVRLGS